MKNLVLLLVVALLSIVNVNATEPVTEPTNKVTKAQLEANKKQAEMITFGMYQDNVKFIGKVERTNTLIFSTNNYNTFKRLSKQRITEYNKGYVSNVKVLVRYHNRKTLVHF